MSWREAFLRQARSENEVRRRLAASDLPECHELHYLQMVTEKLAKAYQPEAADGGPPAPTHVAFVKLLRSVGRSSSMARVMGFDGTRRFRLHVEGLLPLAARVEALAPAAAGFNQPNPEYPWRGDPRHPPVAPADHRFALASPQQVDRLVTLVEALLEMDEVTE